MTLIFFIWACMHGSQKRMETCLKQQHIVTQIMLRKSLQWWCKGQILFYEFLKQTKNTYRNKGDRFVMKLFLTNCYHDTKYSSWNFIKHKMCLASSLHDFELVSIQTNKIHTNQDLYNAKMSVNFTKTPIIFSQF